MSTAHDNITDQSRVTDQNPASVQQAGATDAFQKEFQNITLGFVNQWNTVVNADQAQAKQPDVPKGSENAATDHMANAALGLTDVHKGTGLEAHNEATRNISERNLQLAFASTIKNVYGGDDSSHTGMSKNSDGLALSGRPLDFSQNHQLNFSHATA